MRKFLIIDWLQRATHFTPLVTAYSGSLYLLHNPITQDDSHRKDNPSFQKEWLPPPSYGAFLHVFETRATGMPESGSVRPRSYFPFKSPSFKIAVMGGLQLSLLQTRQVSLLERLLAICAIIVSVAWKIIIYWELNLITVSTLIAKGIFSKIATNSYGHP